MTPSNKSYNPTSASSREGYAVCECGMWREIRRVKHYLLHAYGLIALGETGWTGPHCLEIIFQFNLLHFVATTPYRFWRSWKPYLPTSFRERDRKFEMLECLNRAWTWPPFFTHSWHFFHSLLGFHLLSAAPALHLCSFVSKSCLHVCFPTPVRLLSVCCCLNPFCVISWSWSTFLLGQIHTKPALCPHTSLWFPGRNRSRNWTEAVICFVPAIIQLYTYMSTFSSCSIKI